MDTQPYHHFHIPVMGTAFTVDTPIKVAKYGIASVMSIGDDALCETMREHYCKEYNLPFTPIPKDHNEYRHNRIKSYLNLVQDLVDKEFEAVKNTPISEGSESSKYFELLPDNLPLKTEYLAVIALPQGAEREQKERALRSKMKPGNVDGNIMTKIDRDNLSPVDKEPLPLGYSDALSALGAFAESKVRGNIVFSAGFNRRLYAHCENYDDFYPDENGEIKKGIILKVSDFRSSVIQGRFLAKKGLWIADHRIESGLNCGGHAFATDGFVLGPIMQEFKDKRHELSQELFELCNAALEKKQRPSFKTVPPNRVTVQGGIGTAAEQDFILSHYGMDGTGWASPFLLVPEVSILDERTRTMLSESGKDKFYLSGISPLGVPFNTVKGTDSEAQRLERIDSGRPGSPCPKAHLVSNTEFTKKMICTASTLYQKRKLEEIEGKEEWSEQQKQRQKEKALVKTCLCEDLAASALSENNMQNNRPLKTVVCPGPNLAYFTEITTLQSMVDHIYARKNLLNPAVHRPHFLIAELKMYCKYLENEHEDYGDSPTEKQIKYLQTFHQNLRDGIAYYQQLFQRNESASCNNTHTNADLTEVISNLEQYTGQHPEIYSTESLAA